MTFSLKDDLTENSYQIANYAMEPIRGFTWGILRAFVAPSYDIIQERLDNLQSQKISNEEELEKLIKQKEIFSVSSPYFKMKVQETVFRIALGTAMIAIPFIGMNIISIPYVTKTIQMAFSCGVLGQALHAGLSFLSNKKFHQISYNKNAPEDIQKCTSIATWNIGLVSVFAPLNVGTWESLVSFHWMKKLLNKMGVQNETSRIEMQAQILKEKIDTDIVCFQEFFDPLQAKALHKEVEKHYPYAYLNIAPHVWKGPSGIGIFSKIPLKNFEVHDFKISAAGLDKGTNKKFITFDVEIQGTNTKVYVAHLNCGNNPETRKNQLIEIYHSMQNVLRTSDIKRCMILGDLNFDRNDSIATDRNYFNENFSDDLHSNIPITCSNILQHIHSLDDTFGHESIDYIATSNESKQLENPKMEIVIDGQVLNASDHLPLTMRF